MTAKEMRERAERQINERFQDLCKAVNENDAFIDHYESYFQGFIAGVFMMGVITTEEYRFLTSAAMSVVYGED